MIRRIWEWVHWQLANHGERDEEQWVARITVDKIEPGQVWLILNGVGFATKQIWMAKDDSLNLYWNEPEEEK